MLIALTALVDLLIGDPEHWYHPVRTMGRWIEIQERAVRKRAKKRTHFLWGGALMAFINLALIGGGTWYLLRILPPWLHHVFSFYIIYACISTGSLRREALAVVSALETSLERGRSQVARIVGRDTTFLSEEGVLRATVETVAENTSDGIIAPLFYICIFGPAGGLAYKWINTMDSMVGYRDERYRDLGCVPAKLDDVVNFIPARITALLFCILGCFTGRGKESFTVTRRDHGNHLSPNAGYPEAAMAGLLGLRLGGPNVYHGEWVEKPTLGTEERKIEKRDVHTSILYVYGAEGLFLLMALSIQYFI